MSRREDLLRLDRIAALRLDMELARLRAASARCQEVEEELDSVARGLDATREADWHAVPTAPLHEAWAEARRRSLNLELARRRIAQDEVRVRAATAFGRQQAIEGLARRLQSEARAMAEARRPAPDHDQDHGP